MRCRGCHYRDDVPQFSLWKPGDVGMGRAKRKDQDGTLRCVYCPSCLLKRRIAGYLKQYRSRAAKPAGAVYVVTNPAWPEYVKVGRTSGSPEKRLGSFNTGDPLKRFSYAAFVEVEDDVKAEAEIHHMLKADRVREDGEWFKTPVDVAVRLVESFRIRRGCDE